MRTPALLVALGLTFVGATATPVPSRAQAPDPVPDPAKVQPSEIWPASLERIAGRYSYAGVASPGGLWLSDSAGRRQVSVNELSAEARNRLTQAEIIISDLKLPAAVEASQRRSPSGRGLLRHYEEQAPGRLVLRNLRGIGGLSQDPGAYEGPVMFGISHSSHSNPSVSGILTLRRQQEATWGAATLDYADLSAVPATGQEDPETQPVIGNARILRSGVEIFAFVGWQEKSADGAERDYTGSVRLVRR